MARITDFHFFDPKQEYSVTYGELPHWEQTGATYFITFRTADSLPIELIELWQQERNAWLSRQTNDKSDIAWFEKFKRLTPDQKASFNREFRHKFEKQMDECHGDCLLRQRMYAEIVADSLHYFDGQRYSLGDFVVMPNHVHLLASFYKGVRLRKQCYSWKHFTAAQINRSRGVKQTFWQTESFDHLVRDLDHFRHFQKYIRNNPSRAGLKEGEFIHYTIGM